MSTIEGAQVASIAKIEGAQVASIAILQEVKVIIGHVVPEAQEGGPIGLVRDGDMIHLDADANTIDVELSDEELKTRRDNWTMPPYKTSRGTLYKYIKNVKTASEGCVTDE